MSILNDYDEQKLSALLMEGDENVFVEIYRRNWRSMYNAAYKRLGDEKQCEDLVQNIFTDLWDRRNEVLIENISAYLHTAVRFQVIKYSTRLKNVTPLIENLENELISPLRSEDLLIESEISSLLTLWINALPERRREAFLMYYREGLSSAHIAEILGTTQKTVQNHIATASASIREQVLKTLPTIILILLSHLLIAIAVDTI